MFSLVKKLFYLGLFLALAYLVSVGPYVFLVGKKKLPDSWRAPAEKYFTLEHMLEQQPWASGPIDAYKRWWWRMSQKDVPTQTDVKSLGR